MVTQAVGAIPIPIDVNPVKTPVSDNIPTLFWMIVPLVESNLANALSVELAGPTTVPDASTVIGSQLATGPLLTLVKT
jgi:hypothetical protein